VERYRGGVCHHDIHRTGAVAAGVSAAVSGHPGDDHAEFLFGLLCGAVIVALFCGIAHFLR
jgi:hypothetical protein